jgi:hypothetical protein
MFRRMDDALQPALPALVPCEGSAPRRDARVMGDSAADTARIGDALPGGGMGEADHERLFDLVERRLDSRGLMGFMDDLAEIEAELLTTRGRDWV